MASLDIRPLFRMPAQIPARQISSVGKQRIDASPRLRRIKKKFGLSILLQHRVVVPHHDRAVGTPVHRHSKPEDRIVRCEGKQTCSCNAEDCRKEYPPQSSFEVLRRTLTHEPELYLAKSRPLSSVFSVSPWFLGALSPHHISPLTILPPTGKLPHSPRNASGECH